MKDMKTYQTPEILIFPISNADLLTVSDNDTGWDDAWNNIFT